MEILKSNLKEFKPSILFLNHNLAARATYFRNFHLARVLASLGWKPTLWTASTHRTLFSKSEQIRGVHVVQTPWLDFQYVAANGCCLWDVAWRTSHILRQHFDVVVASDHLPNVSVPYALARWMQNMNVSVTDWADLFSDGGCHASWEGKGLGTFARLEQKLEIGIKKGAHRCTATSRALQKRLIDAGISPERTLYLPSGCDVVTPPVSIQSTRSELGIDPGLLVLGRTGSQGRVSAWEVDELLRLMKRAERISQRSVGILLVGDHKPGWYPQWREAGLKVFVTGRKPSEVVPTLLAAADACVLLEEDTPFNRHRGPIRLADYLIAGRPVIVNSVGDLTPLLVERKAGVCCDHIEGTNDLLDAVLRDEQLRAEMGVNARSLAEGELSWDYIGRRFSEFIRSRASVSLQ